MKSIFYLFLFLLLIIVGTNFAAGNYPFPQQTTYPNGNLPDGVSPKHVQQVYDIWLQNYYEENGNQARIKFDEPENTVSEGIGYGMLVFVFMDNEENNTQGKFDKLWAYYNNNLDGNGLMNWKISGFGGVIGGGAATDAELDVAVALIMADKQWGGSYLNDAKSLISKIGQFEVSGNLLKGGDQWDALNPSYLSMVATQLFQNIGGGNWGAIQDRCYQLLDASQHNTTGMWPNWCDASGNPGGGSGTTPPAVYGFDACRTPWRLGWAYAWYGHNEASTLCGNIVDYFRSANVTGGNPANIGQQYNLDGSINIGAGGSEDNIPTYLGPMTIAGMVSPPYSDWLNKGYKRLRSFNGSNDNYYNECLELLSMLLLTGNMPDFTSVEPKTSATLTVKVNPSSGGSVAVSPQKSSYSIGEQVTLTATSSNLDQYNFVNWNGDFEGTTTTASFKVTYDMTVTANFKDERGGDLLDDCEDGDGLTRSGIEWFTYTDVADDGASTISPETIEDELQLEMTSGGYSNSDYAVKVEYSLNQGGFEYDPFIGVGFALNEEQTGADISMSTGISFAYKGTFGSGDTCALKCESEAVTESGASYSYTLPPSTEWTEIMIQWDEFLQPKWAEPVDLDLSVVPKIQWQIQGLTGDSGELWLDDIHIIGYTIPVVTKACPRISTTGKLIREFSCRQIGSDITVNYSITKSGNVAITLFSLTGRAVHVLSSGFQTAGSHSIRMNTGNRTLSNSTYLLHMATPEGRTNQMLIISK